MNHELLHLLACPKCHGRLTLRADESAFVCPSCRLVFSISDDIPNFIVEEASPLEDADR